MGLGVSEEVGGYDLLYLRYMRDGVENINLVSRYFTVLRLRGWGTDE